MNPNDPFDSYKLAAALRRAKLVSLAAPIAGEVKPAQGRIRATLGGKPVSRERQAAVFGPPSIAIPEFSIVRKRKPA